MIDSLFGTRVERLYGTFSGVVVDNGDPAKLGRIRTRVPHVYGPVGGQAGIVPDNLLPWAMPAGLAAGESNESGGFSHIPCTGDRVFVRFLDGEPEKPVWEWAMQDREGQQALAVNTYSGGNSGSNNPNASATQQTQAGATKQAATDGKWSNAGDTGPVPGLDPAKGYNLQVRSTYYYAGETDSPDPLSNAGIIATSKTDDNNRPLADPGLTIGSTANPSAQFASATQVGIAAVDPSVIPLGSQIIVQTADGPRYYIAGDTGGAVTGNHIDFNSDKQIGGTNQTVTVIPYTGGKFTQLSASQQRSFLDVSKFPQTAGGPMADPSSPPAAPPTTAQGTPAAQPAPAPAKASRRAAWTRYGHIVEFSPTQTLISTGDGYSLTHSKSSSTTQQDGFMSWKTPKNNYISVNDDPSGDHIDLNVSHLWQATFQELHFTGSTFEFYGRSFWKAQFDGDITVTGKAKFTRTIEQDVSTTTKGNEDRSVTGDLTLGVHGNLTETAEVWKNTATATTIQANTALTLSSNTLATLKAGGHSIIVSAAGINFT